jgi:hypothetical protein
VNTPRRRGQVLDDREGQVRFAEPTTGDERAVLHGLLRDQRRTFELKCAGLGTELASRSVPPSTLSLLGLIRHLADVERRWFRSVLAGEPALPRFSTPERPDGDFDGAQPDHTLVTEAWTAWRQEAEFADRFVLDAPHLDVEGADAWRGVVSLRWVIAHLVEEYARHNGHADLLRECIDGQIGI